MLGSVSIFTHSIKVWDLVRICRWQTETSLILYIISHTSTGITQINFYLFYLLLIYLLLLFIIINFFPSSPLADCFYGAQLNTHLQLNKTLISFSMHKAQHVTSHQPCAPF